MPLTRRPVALALGSATLSVASPAVEMTLAVVPAVYVLPMPGVNAPNAAGVPSVSASVAGTVPLAVPPVEVARAEQDPHPLLELLGLGEDLRPRGGVAAWPGLGGDGAQRVDVGQRRAVAAPA